MSINKFFAAAITALVLFSFSSCEKDEPARPTIAAIAVTNADFSQLEAAAVQGGVAVTLSNPNPNDLTSDFTVFAPNNAAFGRLGLVAEGDFAVLNKSFLTNTLLYHVSNGNLPGAEVGEGMVSGSLLGPDRRFINRDGDLYINGSQILATDVQAENGTVHVIDKVLLATGVDIVQSAIALASSEVFRTPELTFLVEAVVYAELAGALTAAEGSPSFTVFAPSDAAFRQLGEDLGVSLEQPEDIRKLPKETVAAVLLNHVIADGGKFTSEMNQGTITPLGESPLSVGAFNNGVLTVQGNNNSQVANMLIPDVQTVNGVVHMIDRVLLP
ncbi:fasciclin domain-containing protein [Lewinella sp. W8]|uniref:fasciclin domain-containing protein n=1 Tax=Lewinella sp. W8 TaxID=2528208 RepID=UPI0010673AEB|nr:fasciclin domain-containing protein [Lewinella sp. W8]MTB53449.1 fasciclin domain-containing protein [Lewinella sp. W8]